MIVWSPNIADDPAADPVAGPHGAEATSDAGRLRYDEQETLISSLRGVPTRLRNAARQVPTGDIDEREVKVESSPHTAAGVGPVRGVQPHSHSGAFGCFEHIAGAECR